MGTTSVRRPPAPSAAERARSAAARGGPAALVGTGSPVTHPRYHHVRADGSAVLLLASDEPVLERLRAADPAPGDRTGRGELAVMLELADPAPVELRERVRGLLWITGRLREVPDETARRIAVGLAEVDPDPGLLELGHTATMVRLQPGFAVLADAEGTSTLTPLDLAGARPDPFCRYEQRWLAHLDQSHPEIFTRLARHLPAALRGPGTSVRPLGVDRCGLRLRVENGERDHDVRLACEHPISTTAELKAQLQRLVGCPLREADATEGAA